MFGRKKHAPITGRIDTLISPSARVQGDVEFSGGLHLDGRVNGHVRSAGTEAATLWISEQGAVEGSVEVPSVVINGTVIGDVYARERVAIGPQSRITGNVHYGTMEMALGAQIDGKLIPMGAAAAVAAAQPARLSHESAASAPAEQRAAAG
jgi:cytoskeletal protein CcmA (bactofilin family)